MSRNDLRRIPSITELVRTLLQRGIAVTEPGAVVLAREVQRATRAALVDDGSRSLDQELDWHIERIGNLMARSRFRPVINASGILIHTNLGRVQVSESVARAMSDAASSTVSLEVEPDTGRRGGRMAEVSTLLRLLTGAEAALVVNNNAAAILLTLSALVRGRAVAVSRAEAVEIGGGFRIPDVLAQSGARLVEVGTTNRTYAADYRHPDIGQGDAILRVHASNFALSGFVARPSASELREVATERAAILIDDLGSGTLIDTARLGVDHEPTVQEVLDAGIDVVTFSGDKLLGGPQAGIIAGRRVFVDRIAKAPLARAVRADKTTLAGLAETLRHYLRGDALHTIPLYRMMSARPEELQRRARKLGLEPGPPGVSIDVVATTNHVGGGALPGQELPGVAVRVSSTAVAPHDLARRLRLDALTPVFGRIDGGALLLELRSILPEDDARLADAVRRGTSQAGAPPG
jgi:L-seryl-tRNA(Ser) seleniumtransferase